MSKKLILIRHAHRDTSEPRRDNGLSEKGRSQVKQLQQYFQRCLRGEEMVPIFLSSPKKRCLETLGPVAEKLGSKVEIFNELSEANPMESRSDFEKRIDQFLDDWKGGKSELTVVCSHGDWIPICVEKLTGARIGIKKAGFVEIESFAGECFLVTLIQKLPL